MVRSLRAFSRAKFSSVVGATWLSVMFFPKARQEDQPLTLWKGNSQYLQTLTIQYFQTFLPVAKSSSFDRSFSAGSSYASVIEIFLAFGLLPVVSYKKLSFWIFF